MQKKFFDQNKKTIVTLYFEVTFSIMIKDLFIT